MSDFNKQSYIERGKRIDSQVNEFLAERADRMAASKEAEIKSLRESLMTGAATGINQSIHNNKIREKNLEESLTYLEKTSKAALTEMVAGLVERSLLLDEYTYSRLNPGYKESIRETVAGLLEGVKTFDITDANVSYLIETISKQIPSPTSSTDLSESTKPTSIPLDYAISLTEARVKATMEGDGGEDVNAAIDDLSGNVKKRVAKIVDKDKKALQKAEAEYADAVGADPNAAPAEDPNAMPPEEGAPEDPNAVPLEGEMPPEGGEEMPPEEGMDPNGMPPADGSPKKQIQMLPDGTMNINVFESAGAEAPVEEMPEGEEELPPEEGMDPNGMPPKKQVVMPPDGSVTVNVYEQFVREMPACGILEVLAINEAMDMVNEGKEYNSDLAIANAITYITILETLDVTGILPVTSSAYDKIIAAAKGVKTEDAAKFAPKVHVPKIKIGTVDRVNVPAVDPPGSDAAQSLSDYIKGNSPKTVTGKDEKKEKADDKKKTLTESEIVDLLESCGYSLNVDDFEECYRAQGYKKIGADKYIKL